MSIFKRDYVAKPIQECATVVPQGTCGDCGEPAFDNVSAICKSCAYHYGVDTFPDYTYPSELMFHSADIALKRRYFVKGIMY